MSYTTHVAADVEAPQGAVAQPSAEGDDCWVGCAVSTIEVRERLLCPSCALLFGFALVGIVLRLELHLGIARCAVLFGSLPGAMCIARCAVLFGSRRACVDSPLT
jgi:hypothetical protein